MVLRTAKLSVQLTIAGSNSAALSVFLQHPGYLLHVSPYLGADVAKPQATQRTEHTQALSTQPSATHGARCGALQAANFAGLALEQVGRFQSTAALGMPSLPADAPAGDFHNWRTMGPDSPAWLKIVNAGDFLLVQVRGKGGLSPCILDSTALIGP